MPVLGAPRIVFGDISTHHRHVAGSLTARESSKQNLANMFGWVVSLAHAAHRADFWSRLCFIGLSAIVAACSAYGFFTEYRVWDGFNVASAGGVALAALCAISQFCSLNLSHQARRREGRDRALCLVLMTVCGGWSAYGLHNFWDIVQAAAAQAAGQAYVPVRTLEDIDGPAALMVAICVAIAFVEPLTFWVLGGKAPARQLPAENVTTLDASRRRPGRRTAAAMAAAIAMGTAPGLGPHSAEAAVSQSTRTYSTGPAARVRDVSLAQVVGVADRMHGAGKRVSLRRLAAEIGTSKSKIDRLLNSAGVAIGERWPPRLVAA